MNGVSSELDDDRIISFMLIGHVDHGKSTLGGHLLHLCGYANEREVEKAKCEALSNGMASFGWAYLLDICQEEKERGITMECNVIEFSFSAPELQRFRLIDTPGHRIFSRNLIEAMFSSLQKENEDSDHSCNICVLVISCLKGEREGGNREEAIFEKLSLARAVGIRHLVVAVNKMDKNDWNEQEMEETRVFVKEMIRSLKFEQTIFVPVSALTGEGLVPGIPGPYVHHDHNCSSLISALMMVRNLSQKKKMEAEREFLITKRNQKLDAFLEKLKHHHHKEDGQGIIINCFVRIIALPENGLLTVGFNGIVHSRLGENEFSLLACFSTVTTTQDRKRLPHLCRRDSECLMSLALSEKEWKCFSEQKGSDLIRNDKLVLRQFDRTLAFGIVL